MRKTFLLTTVSAVLAACGGNDFQDRMNAKLGRSASSDTTIQAKKKEEPPVENINNDNAREFLTEYGKQNPETIVLIRTPKGNMKVRLYEETPLHRANFIRLAKIKFYDEGTFHRVIKDFVIQAGDSDVRKMKISRYQIPMEVNPRFFHKKGALAMAKYDEDTGSSSHVFFIIQGTPLSELQLKANESQFKLKLTPEQRRTYLDMGGVPAIDGKYTVFGEVVEGLDVIDKIAAVKTGTNDWPLERIDTKMEVLK